MTGVQTCALPICFTALGWGKAALPQIGTYHALARRHLGGSYWPMSQCVDVGGKDQKVPGTDALFERIVDTGRIFPTNLEGLNLRERIEQTGLKPTAYATVIGALRGYGATPDNWEGAGPLARATAQSLPGLREVWRRYKDRKSTRLNSSHIPLSRMPSSA